MNRNPAASSTCAGNLKFLSLRTFYLIGIDDARKNPRRRGEMYAYGN